MVELMKKVTLARRLTQIAVFAIIGTFIIFAISFLDSPVVLAVPAEPIPVVASEASERVPVNHDVTYVLYFEKTALSKTPVLQKVLDSFVKVYSDFVKDDLNAEIGHSFDSVLAGFTFKLPHPDETRKKLVALHSGALHSGDLTSLLYQYLTHHAEMQLISNGLELHLEKDQTMTHQDGVLIEDR